MVASAEELIAATEVEATLPSGLVVQLRALSVEDVRTLPDGVEPELWYVHLGMVDPAMSLEQVDAWRRAPGRAGDFLTVSRWVLETSGLLEGAQKAAYKSLSG